MKLHSLSFFFLVQKSIQFIFFEILDKGHAQGKADDKFACGDLSHHGQPRNNGKGIQR